MKNYAKEQGNKEKMNGSSCVSIPIRRRGRPPMLGSIDQKVRDFLITLRHRGGIVSSTIAIAVGKAFISESCDESVKNFCIGQSWAKVFFEKWGLSGVCQLQLKSLYLIKPGKKLNLFLCTRLLRKKKSIIYLMTWL